MLVINQKKNQETNKSRSNI